MRFAYLSLSVLFILPIAQAQSTGSTTGPSSSLATETTGTASPRPLQDPQAVSILNQVIAASGGTQAISAVSDYTATGNITYYPGQQVQGTVTVRGLGTWEFRIDAVLPAGTRSLVVHQGIVSRRSENGTISSQVFRINVPSSDAYPYQTPLFPSGFAFPAGPLPPLLAKQTFGISYNGLTQIDGHSVHDIQLRRDLPGALGSKTPPVRSRDVFIDTSTLQIVAIHETLEKNIPHELHYSDYQNVGGILIPFNISEDIAGQLVSTISLSQIAFNAGLTEAAFVLQ
jgi:hypothetical protein